MRLPVGTDGSREHYLSKVLIADGLVNESSSLLERRRRRRRSRRTPSESVLIKQSNTQGARA